MRGQHAPIDSNFDPLAASDLDILTMMLQYTRDRSGTAMIAKNLLDFFGSFEKLMTASENDLLSRQGITTEDVHGISIVKYAAIALLKRQIVDRCVLTNKKQLLDYLHAVLSNEIVEQTRVLFLDSRNHLVADEVHSTGTVNRVALYPREIIRKAIEYRATGLILVHNHPSGDPVPSDHDLKRTQELLMAADLFDVTLLDHIVVGKTESFSFKELGLL